MRIPLAATAALAAGFLSTGAAAVDLGPLRGGYGSGGLEPVVTWQGGYFAGFAGQTNASFQADKALGDLIAFGLRRTIVEEEMQVSEWLNPQIPDASDTTFGVLAGYNFQFAETILGIEADVTLGALSSSGLDTLSRVQTLSNNERYNVTAKGNIDAKLENWATLRARAGYTLGAFLPFVTGGIALAQYEVVRSAGVDGSRERVDDDGLPITGAVPLQPVSETGTDSGIALGLAAGAGLDVALTQNVFLRGEWQYLFFPDLAGVEMSVNTWRAAAGVKF
ncbi:outer membrane protein [Salinarimonas ramus]|uniref:Outer membrane protein beta-barrel domain-containing protein n=1 Tax=Salinarimonas ramus TaxID=690164 RepID=A0A917Q7S0_9HYPH|nr:outer membrane beta-barrel protein [Salinarimonas ramus]GGK34285.1 hypothetical protein GCM10011322_21270 [Salinarimonas ramus]